MSPEEKAKELIQMFLLHITQRYVEQGRQVAKTEYSAAKQCAAICAKETIDALTKVNPNYEKQTYWHPIDYWNQVLSHLTQ